MDLERIEEETDFDVAKDGKKYILLIQDEENDDIAYKLFNDRDPDELIKNYVSVVQGGLDESRIEAREIEMLSYKIETESPIHEQKMWRRAFELKEEIKDHIVKENLRDVFGGEQDE